MAENSPAFIYQYLDVRELTIENQSLMLDAVSQAYSRRIQLGFDDWDKKLAECSDKYMELLRSISEQVSLLESGRVPDELPFLVEIPDHSGIKAGPGWKH